MELVQVADARPATEKIVALLRAAQTRGERAVWLVSGGSAIGVAVHAMRKLSQGGDDLSWLTIMQVDERFGAVGHADSNWRQLLAAGFEPGSARAQPILDGSGLDETVKNFAANLHEAFTGSTYKLGLFGIGADGHTAGILPHSSACEPADDWSVGYDAPDFVRITITPAAIVQLDAAVVCAMGEAKAPALARLQQDLPVAEQPAQVLKLAKQTWIFSDQIKDKGGTT